MHPSKRQLGEALKPLLREHGYRKRAMTWHRANESTIQVFHVEKSRWGFDDYELHFAIYIRALGPEMTPPHYRCPIQVILHHLVPDRMTVLDLCDFEKGSLDPATRITEIVRLVADYGLPWLDAHSSMPALKELVNCEYHKLVPRSMVKLAAYDYLRALQVE
jgi:hypothetical protein